MSVSDIIEQLGGTNAVASYTGWPYTTIDTWRAKNYIPAWRQPKVLELALELKLDVSAADFPEKQAA
jgi:hypothetical protein